MEETPFLKEELVTLTDSDGKERKYILSNFPAVEGRRILTQYTITGLPKIGEYEENEKMMKRLMNYVAILLPDGRKLRLSTEALIDNHVPDAETLMNIEALMMKKNCSFFRDGGLQNFFDNLLAIATQKFLEMLTRSSPQSSEPEKQPSTN